MKTEHSALAEAIFVAKAAYRELNQVVEETRHPEPPAILYNDLMRLAGGLLDHGRQGQIDKLILGINDNVVLRKQYCDLVKRLSFARCPALAAASTEQDMPSRQADNMLLKFKRDSLNTHQVFALLSIEHPNDKHNRENIILHVLGEERCERIEFPPLIEGSTQCLFDEKDSKLQFLLDLDAEISIMP